MTLQQTISATRIALGTSRLVLFTLIGLFGLVAGPGCKAMTKVQEEAQAVLAKKEAEAEKTLEENDEELQKLKKEQHEKKLKLARLEAERDRALSMQGAADAMSQGDLEQAIAILDPMIESNGRVAIEAMQTFEGETAYTSEFDKKNLGFALLVAGISKFQLGSADGSLEREAAAMIARAVELDPSSRDARETLAKVYFSLEDYANALDALQKDFQAGYRSTDLLFLAAQARYYLAGERKNTLGQPDRLLLQSARQAIDEAFIADPSREELQQWKVLLATELEDWDAALTAIDEILSANPFDPDYTLTKVQCLLGLDRYEEAIDVLEQLDQFEKLEPAIARQLGDLYSQIGLHHKAAEWFLRGFGNDPDRVRPEVLLRVGISLARSGNVALGRDWLSRVESNTEEYAEALQELAYLAEAERDVDGAIGFYKRLVEDDPDRASAWFSLGELQRSAGQLNEAEAAYVKASSFEKTKASGFVGLAEVAYERGLLDDSIDLYRRAVDAAPERKHYKAALAEIVAQKSAQEFAQQSVGETP